VDRTVHHDLARIQTDLALVEERSESSGRRCCPEVGVREHDLAVVAAKFQHDPLERPACARSEQRSGAGRAGEIDGLDDGASEKHICDLDSAAWRVWHQVQHTRRQPGIRENLRDGQPARNGGQLGGLSTMVLPNAIGETTVRQPSRCAPFQGLKPAMTPSGFQTAKLKIPGSAKRSTSPAGR
jgi:hypothetical protein